MLVPTDPRLATGLSREQGYLGLLCGFGDGPARLDLSGHLSAEFRGEVGACVVAEREEDPGAERLQESARQASEVPSTDRSEDMDWVATMGMTRHCRVRANAFSSPDSDHPRRPMTKDWYSSQMKTAGRK